MIWEKLEKENFRRNFDKYNKNNDKNKNTYLIIKNIAYILSHAF